MFAIHYPRHSLDYQFVFALGTLTDCLRERKISPRVSGSHLACRLCDDCFIRCCFNRSIHLIDSSVGLTPLLDLIFRCYLAELWFVLFLFGTSVFFLTRLSLRCPLTVNRSHRSAFPLVLSVIVKCLYLSFGSLFVTL